MTRDLKAENLEGTMVVAVVEVAAVATVAEPL
jgi:hypothetical protein